MILLERSSITRRNSAEQWRMVYAYYQDGVRLPEGQRVAIQVVWGSHDFGRISQVTLQEEQTTVAATVTKQWRVIRELPVEEVYVLAGMAQGDYLRVMDRIQELEEIGGPSLDNYIAILTLVREQIDERLRAATMQVRE